MTPPLNRLERLAAWLVLSVAMSVGVAMLGMIASGFRA